MSNSQLRNKITRDTNKKESMTCSRKKKNNRNCPVKYLIEDLQDEEIKAAILKVLKEFKEDMDKVKETKWKYQ
jgi:hypothetical protein